MASKNCLEVYSTRNEGKTVVAERFIRALNNKIYKHITSVSKNVQINKLDDIVIKYNNKYSTIKTKPVDVKSSKYIDFDKKNNKENTKVMVGDHLRISKYKSNFAKVVCQIGPKKFFLLQKLKIWLRGHML